MLTRIQIKQAAARVAYAERSGRPPPEDALTLLAAIAQTGLEEDSTQVRGALQRYGAGRLARRLGQLEVSPARTPQNGHVQILYKSPLPGEQQARLSYEYVLSEFQRFLERRALAVVTSESAAHVALWLPDDALLDLSGLWEAFMAEMTGSGGLKRGFGLVMNSSKLSAKGFSTLEVPIVSESQPQAIAAFYLANIAQVARRLQGRERAIAAGEAELVTAEPKKQPGLLKRLAADRAKNAEETEKYQTEFVKMFGSRLEAEWKAHEAIAELDSQLVTASGKERAKLLKQRAKHSVRFDSETARLLRELYVPDPFLLIGALQDHPHFGPTWRAATAEARRHSATAAQQIGTAKGDIYAKVLWETCVLLYGHVEITPLPPLLSTEPVLWKARPAGDNVGAACYSCGRLLEGPSFPARRLLFESPEQRAQSAGSSSAPEVCPTCAALSLLSPIKFAPDTVVVKLVGGEGIQDRVRATLEQAALNELGASAGPYINLSCTEYDKDSRPASDKLGLRQYATAKLAQLFPPEVLRHLRPVLFTGGQEVPLAPAVLVGTSLLMRVYRQGILAEGETNRALGSAIRLLERTSFISACYLLATQHPRDVRGALESASQLYVHVLEGGTMSGPGKSPDATKPSAQTQLFKDVNGLIGLLTPFCRQIMGRDDLNLRKDEREREVAKLIQKVNGEPSVFSYAAAQIVGGVGTLKRDHNTFFVFQCARDLMSEFEITPELDDPDTLRVNLDVVSAVMAGLLERYPNDYDRKNLMYQTRMGLFARFPDAIPNRKGDR